MTCSLLLGGFFSLLTVALRATHRARARPWSGARGDDPGLHGRERTPYVFAIGQLSHHLLEHVDLRTGAETLILALAVFYAWYMTAWGANYLQPDLAVATAPLTLIAGIAASSAVLVAVAIADTMGQRDQASSMLG